MGGGCGKAKPRKGSGRGILEGTETEGKGTGRAWGGDKQELVGGSGPLLPPQCEEKQKGPWEQHLLEDPTTPTHGRADIPLDRPCSGEPAVVQPGSLEGNRVTVEGTHTWAP